MRSLTICMMTSLLLGSSAVPTLAAEAKLSFAVAGEAYNGPPIFLVYYGTELVGAGTADQSIDSQPGLDDSNIAAHTQTFNFTIYDFDPKAPKPISFQYQTDAYGGEGLDRNLYIVSASIDGTPFPFDNAKTVRNGKLAKAEQGKVGTVPLWNAYDTAIFTLPGWPAVTAPIIASAAPAPAPAATPASKPTAAPANKPAAAAPANKPVATAPAKPKPAPSSSAASSDSTKAGVAAAAPAAQPQPQPAKPAPCAPASISLTGFKNATVKVSASDQQAIAALAHSIAGRGCYVTVTGYSGVSGDASYNGNLNSTRAGNVARLLTSLGVQVAARGVVNGGPTDQFGKRNKDNVRVVVTIKP